MFDFFANDNGPVVGLHKVVRLQQMISRRNRQGLVKRVALQVNLKARIRIPLQVAHPYLLPAIFHSVLEFAIADVNRPGFFAIHLDLDLVLPPFADFDKMTPFFRYD